MNAATSRLSPKRHYNAGAEEASGGVAARRPPLRRLHLVPWTRYGDESQTPSARPLHPLSPRLRAFRAPLQWSLRLASRVEPAAR